MKLIHTADIHLGSALIRLPKEKAKRRAAEIFESFSRLVVYAKSQGVYAVLIAGDLFDANTAPEYLKRDTLSLIRSASPVKFFYITGNHDDKALDKMELPDNLYRFVSDNRFITYELPENVTLSGVDNNAAGELGVYQSLRLPNEKYNIVMMHGSLINSSYPDKDAVCLPEIWNKNIDYLALGHIHNPPAAAPFDTRGKFRYSGCLEGRGFDECGKKGAWLLEISNGRMVREEFLPFASRTLHELSADIGGVKDFFSLQSSVEEKLSKFSNSDLIKLRLVGGAPPQMKGELLRLASVFENRFFYFRMLDETKTELRAEDYANDGSTRGEFVRLLSSSNEPNDVRMQALALGLAALAGENIEV